MRIEQLKYLIELSKSTSISSAAERLHISHQALSATIKALEKELDTKLIERNFSGISLTSEGKYLVKISQEFCHKLQRFNKTDVLAKKAIQGEIRVAASGFAADVLLPKIIANFYVENPRINITVVNLTPQQVVKSYKDGQTDLAFLGLYYDSDSIEDFMIEQDITFTPCLKLLFCVETLRTAPLAEKRYVTMEQLKQYCVIFNCTPQTSEDKFNQGIFHHIKGRKTIYEPNKNVYLELLRSGCGIGTHALFKSQPINRPSEDLAYIPIKDSKEFWLGYLLKDQKLPTESAMRFLEHLNSYYQVDRQ